MNPVFLPLTPYSCCTIGAPEITRVRTNEVNIPIKTINADLGTEFRIACFLSNIDKVKSAPAAVTRIKNFGRFMESKVCQGLIAITMARGVNARIFWDIPIWLPVFTVEEY
jgi:hypothetical protein